MKEDELERGEEGREERASERGALGCKVALLAVVKAYSACKMVTRRRRIVDGTAAAAWKRLAAAKLSRHSLRQSEAT